MRNRKAWFQRMRRVLLHRREDLLRTLAGELGQFNTSNERMVGDWADEALDCDYGVVNSQLAEAESRELDAIECALERMVKKTYGVCEDCGREIPLVRLQALPCATTCIACQRGSERKQTEVGQSGDWSRIRDPSDSSEGYTFDDIELVR